jgi:hypothetical protein
MAMLFYAHSGLRYLVLLAAAAALAYFLASWLRGADFDKPARILTAIYVGLLDLQVLLGVLLWLTVSSYGALYGHIVMMLAAATAGHVASVINRRREPPSWSVGLAGVGVSLVLLIGGIMAIGRPILGSGGS